MNTCFIHFVDFLEFRVGMTNEVKLEIQPKEGSA